MNPSSYNPTFTRHQRYAHADAYPSPFADYASLVMPQSWPTALDVCEALWQANATYRMAQERVISYFLKELDFEGVGTDLGDDERDKFENFFSNTVDIHTTLGKMWRGRKCYGSSFCSVIVPIIRLIVCPKCGFHISAEEFMTEREAFQFEWKDLHFCGRCPKCQYRGMWRVNDRPDDREDRIKVKVWNPKEISIVFDLISEDCEYYWNIPAYYKRQIQAGETHVLARVPEAVIECIRHNVPLKFNRENIYHMREPTLDGLVTRGWGIPQTLVSFRQIWYVQMLHRYNEAIAMDYVVPFRILSPDGPSGTGTAGDLMAKHSGGEFSWHMRKMVRAHRHDPAGFQVSPFPVKYQMLGGEATQLAPKDLIEQGQAALLNGTGVPLDFFQGTMAVQTAPLGLKLFENTHHSLVHDGNGLLRWLIRRVSQILAWDIVAATLRKSTLADDAQQQLLLLQLMTGQVISQSSGLKPLGLDFRTEIRKIFEEERIRTEEQQRMQEELDQTAMGQQVAQGQIPGQPGQPGQPGDPAAAGGGGQPPGGAPVPGGDQVAQTGGPVSPMTGQSVLALVPPVGQPIAADEQLSTAQQIAEAILPEQPATRRQILAEIRKKNESMWQAVKGQMESRRGQAESQGREQVMQQTYGTN
jgi:hypothetical protein